MNSYFEIFFWYIFPDRNVPTEDEKKLWILTLLLVAPLVCLATHAGYIIIAWISDPQHASSATFIALLSFFYYFISFRQLYKALRKTDFCQLYKALRKGIFCESKIPEVEAGKYVQPRQPGQGSEQGPVSPHEEYIKELTWEKNKAKFNTGLCIWEFFFGVVLFLIEAFVIYTIGWLPFRSTAASVDIFHLLQLSLLALAILITYKILVTDDSLEHRLMRSIAEAYNEQAPPPQGSSGNELSYRL